MKPSRYLRFIATVVLAVLVASPAWADKCSTWLDKAWLNEYFFGTNSFLEIYSKNSAFPSSWQNWTIDVYDKQGNMISPVTLASSNGTFACTKSGNKTWVTKDIADNGFSGTLGLAILKDSSGNYVDAFAFDNAAPPASWKSNSDNYFTTLADATNGCPTLANRLSTQANAATKPSNQANMIIWESQGNKDYSREPDGGTGSSGNPWYITSQTGSGTTYTTCTSNNANLTKSVDVTNVAQGGTVNFKLTFANTASSAITGSIYIIDTLPVETPAMTFVSATSSNSSDTIQYSTDNVTYTSTASSPKYIKWTPSNVGGNSTTTLTVKMTAPSSSSAVGVTYTNNASTGGNALGTQQTDSVSVTVVSSSTPSFDVTSSTTSACTSATGTSAPLITVTAKDAVNGTGNTVTNYTGTVTLGTSSGSGTWTLASGNGTFNATNKTYTFVASDAGVASFHLADATSETIDVTATDASTSPTRWGIYSSITYGATCNSINHVEFVHDGSAINCMAEPVTVYGCTSSSSCYGVSASQTGNSFTVTPTAISGATWCADSACSTTLSTSSATTMTNGTVIYLKDTNTASHTDRLAGTSSASTSTVQCVNSTNTSALNSTTACDLAFSSAGFIIASVANGSAVTSLPSQTAGTSSSTYYLRAVQTSDSTKACTAALTGTTTVNWAYVCNNPTTCYSTNLMTLNGGASTTIIGNANGTSNYSYQPISMTFDANGNAPFTFNYSDVGQVTLYASKSASGTLTAALSGSSPAFVVKPYGYSFSNISCTTKTSAFCGAGALAQSTSGNNPAAANESGGSFIYAGTPFSATVMAITSTGTATPNYGRETSPEGVALTPALVAPSGGTAGSLSGTTTIPGGSFSSGAATVSNLAYSEVGIVTLTAAVADGDYLGAGAVSSTSGNVGRFIPHHFAITAGTTSAACTTHTTGHDSTDFTYYGQDGVTTAFTITAQTASNGTTKNYTGSYAKLGLTTWSNFNFTAATLKTGSSLTASSTAPTGTWGAGTASVSAKHQISRPSSLTSAGGPSDVTISASPVDSDGVTVTTATAVTTGTTNFRYGRLHLANAFGSELLDLSMFGQVEYYNSGWTINDADSCTAFSSPSVTPSPTSLVTTPSYTPPVSAGSLGLKMIKPTGGATGYADIEFNRSGANFPSYLLITNMINNTSARATFGISKTNSRVIYRRESF